MTSFEALGSTLPGTRSWRNPITPSIHPLPEPNIFTTPAFTGTVISERVHPKKPFETSLQGTSASRSARAVVSGSMLPVIGHTPSTDSFSFACPNGVSGPKSLSRTQRVASRSTPSFNLHACRICFSLPAITRIIYVLIQLREARGIRYR